MDFEFTKLLIAIEKIEGPLAIAFASILTLSHLRNSHLSERARDVVKFYFQINSNGFPEGNEEEFRENLERQGNTFIDRYKKTGKISKWLLLAIASYIIGKGFHLLGISHCERCNFLFTLLFFLSITYTFCCSALAAYILVNDMNIGHHTLEENIKLLKKKESE